MCWNDERPSSTRRQVRRHTLRVPPPQPNLHPKKSCPTTDPATASARYAPQQSVVRPEPYATQQQTPTSGYSVTPSSASSLQLNTGELVARPTYAASQQQGHAGTASMAQATSPSMSLQDGEQNNHHHPQHIKSNAEVPVDPNIAASSPTYPPYSPYAPQPHEMNHYQGHPPPAYAQHWPQQYPGHPHGLPGGPYSSPGNGAPGTPASAGPRPGQVRHAPLSSSFHSLAVLKVFVQNRILIRFPRSTPSFPSPAPSNTSDRVGGTKRLSACTNVDGKDVKRHTGR